MERKFECWQCHSTFMADDKQWVECPHCHSDNVECYSVDYSKFVKVAICASIITGIVYGSYLMYDKCTFVKETEKIPYGGTGTIIPPDTTMTDLTPLECQPPILSMVPEVPEFDGKTYSFSIKVEYAPQESFKYILLEAFEDIVIKESNDGNFSKVPYSEEEGGTYRIALCSEDGNNMLSEPKPIIGFIKQQAVTRKMSAQELQDLLLSGDPSIFGVGENDYLAPDLKLKYSKLPSGVLNVPQTLGELYTEKILLEIWVVKVASLEYDELNRISGVTLNIKDNSLDFDTENE